MRPNFALSLSFNGIQLLHQHAGVWGRVGDVDISTSDLPGDLAALLDKARAFSDGPIETKLIVPNDQIKYLTVDATGLDKAELQNAVLGALDGATPYPVDELEFDFSIDAGSVHIAAVAKETLQEAEAFATEHGFAPLGFVAAPQEGNFPKEPDFGLSEFAKSQGIARLETDGTLAIASGDAIPLPKAIAPIPEPNAPIEAPAPAVGFSSRRNAPEAPIAPITAPSPISSEPSAPRLDGVQRKPETALPPVSELSASAAPPPISQQTPQITGKSDVALDEQDVNANLAALLPGAASEDGFLDDVPPLPLKFDAAPAEGALRGAADGAPHADLRAPTFIPEPAPRQEKPKRTSEAAAKVAALAGTAGTAALAGMKGLLAKRAKAPEPEVETLREEVETAREEEKQRMTVFGARKPKIKKAAIPVGGKPRFLGLILTAILLLFLVSVAAWASVFLDEGLARFFGGGDRNRAIAELPAPDAEPNVDELIELASLSTGVDDIAFEELAPVQEPLAQVQPIPPAISPEEAEAKYAATGIWLATPIQPVLPPQIRQDDVYPASIDARITGQDAFALEPLAQVQDTLPSGLAAPPPADSDFAFDGNGLVVATPEGTVTPEGALVFLGRPARVPPAVPERLRSAALTPDTSELAQDTAEATGMSSSRYPRMRPKTLVENTERTQLGGNTRVELSKLRPKKRPTLAKAVEETQAAQAPATRLAVASSRKPSTRPRNFARIVARAQKKAEQQPAPTETRVAAVAPKTVKPRVPSSASVAKTATVKNAINLSRVNLIGVYGKPSSRRALVRLSSGRYKKVKVGDRVDGGRVSAIGEAKLIYSKKGRSVTLRMPKG